MIIDLPSTTSSKINRALLDLREQGGSVALSRVLTLVIVTEDGQAEDPIAAANAASFEHPCRVVVLARGAKRASPRMDAQIRVGGDAGASEVIVLRLYGSLVDHGASVVTPLLLADAPVVVWWPGDAPDLPAEDPIGILADRRITDANSARRPSAQLAKRRESYRPGDTDIAWTRITRWRGLLASALDQPPHEKVTEVTVSGSADSPSTDLLAAWLALALRCPTKRVKSPARSGPGVHSVVLNRRGGPITLVRPEGTTAELTMAHQPERSISLPRRTLRECLSEELRRLDDDEVYAEVLTKGLPLVNAEPAARTARTTPTRTTPTRAGAAKSGTSTAAKPAAKSDTKSGTKSATKPAATTGVRATRSSTAAKTAAKTAPKTGPESGPATARSPRRRKAPAPAPTPAPVPEAEPVGPGPGTEADAS